MQFLDLSYKFIILIQYLFSLTSFFFLLRSNIQKMLHNFHLFVQLNIFSHIKKKTNNLMPNFHIAHISHALTDNCEDKPVTSGI